MKWQALLPTPMRSLKVMQMCHPALSSSPIPPTPPQALHLLSAMWDGGPTLAPDAVSYNTALKACANAFQVRPEALLHPLGGHMKVADYACSIHC